MNCKKDTLEIALAKELCPVCLKEQDVPILMNQILTIEEADKVKKLHNQVIGFSEDVCEECKSKLKENYMYFIGVNKEKSTDKQNPYRNGIIFQANKNNIVKDMDRFANIHYAFLEMTDDEVESLKNQFKCPI